MDLQLTEGEIGVTIIMISHNDQPRFKTRIERDVLPTIAAHPAWKFQIIIIDNSDEDKKMPQDFLDVYKQEYIYHWPGTNLMYGPSMNLALGLCIYPYLIYVCCNHGHMYDPSWIDDLINPMITDPRVAMTGSHYASCDPGVLGFPSHLPRVHIQGGVFGARTEALVAHPYTADQRYIHWGSDVYQCFQLLNAGFTLYNVPTINAVWRQNICSPERWKYIHDYSEG